MTIAVLTRGLPGSGKTTLAGAILDAVPGAVSYSADDHMFRGGRPFELERLSECHRLCMLDFRQAIRRGAPVVVSDNTNIKIEDIQRYSGIAAGLGCPFVVAELVCDEEEAFARNSHGCPREIFDILVRRMEENVLPDWWRVVRVTDPRAAKTIRALIPRPLLRRTG